MKKNLDIEKLQRIVERDLPALENIAILKNHDDYLVFGCYRVIKQPKAHSVEVYKNGVLLQEFTGLRTALSWCIADKYNQYTLGQDIKRLDASKFMLESDLAVRQPLGQKISDAKLKESVMLKIDTRKRRLSAVSQQLDKCVNLAKYWQTRGFNNETARTGRTSTTRTNI
jgi:hypothetical protein